jgi:hypothetical protein
MIGSHDSTWYIVYYARAGPAGGVTKVRAASIKRRPYYIATWGPRGSLQSWEFMKKDRLKEYYKFFLEYRLTGKVLGMSVFEMGSEEFCHFGEVPGALEDLQVSQRLREFVEGLVR